MAVEINLERVPLKATLVAKVSPRVTSRNAPRDPSQEQLKSKFSASSWSPSCLGHFPQFPKFPSFEYFIPDGTFALFIATY